MILLMMIDTWESAAADDGYGDGDGDGAYSQFWLAITCQTENHFSAVRNQKNAFSFLVYAKHLAFR